MSDGVGQLGSYHEVAIVGDERTTHQPQSSGVSRPSVAEIGAPTPGGKRQPAQPIDEHVQKLSCVDRTGGRDSGWHRCQ